MDSAEQNLEWCEVSCCSVGSDPSHLYLAAWSERSPGKLWPFVVCILCNTLMSGFGKFMQDKWPLLWCVCAVDSVRGYCWQYYTSNESWIWPCNGSLSCLVGCSGKFGNPFNLSFLSCDIDRYWTIGMGWRGGKLGKLLPRLGSSITIISK